MRTPLKFHLPPPPPVSRRLDRRPLGNKLQEIAVRSPSDLHALERLADMVLEHLDQEQAQQEA